MYHQPVLLDQCLEGLNLHHSKTYLDLTFGGGGHTKKILERLDGGKVIAFDQDDDARKEAEKIQDSRLLFVQANFRYHQRYLKFYGIEKVDGILADLGISSYQIDEESRGFSTRFDAPLDMRMNRKQELSAMEVVNEYSEQQLVSILSQYGEVRNAKTLAAAILRNRPVKTTGQLLKITDALSQAKRKYKYAAQVFQAIRIEVNQEMTALEEMLQGLPDVLNKEGRLVIMSYHSLEDRMVKNFINNGKIKGEQEKDIYGNVLRPLEPVTRKPIKADENEINNNPRARSARLRIAKKN